MFIAEILNPVVPKAVQSVIVTLLVSTELFGPLLASTLAVGIPLTVRFITTMAKILYMYHPFFPMMRAVVTPTWVPVTILGFSTTAWMQARFGGVNHHHAFQLVPVAEPAFHIPTEVPVGPLNAPCMLTGWVVYVHHAL